MVLMSRVFGNTRYFHAGMSGNVLRLGTDCRAYLGGIFVPNGWLHVAIYNTRRIIDCGLYSHLRSSSEH